MKDKIYRLYRECFPEQTVEQQENFVANNFNGENVSTLCEGDEPIAMVFVNDSKLIFEDEAIECPILSGLCVKPHERKKGFGRKLIVKTMNEQRASGKTALRIMSDDLHYFEPLGFTAYCASQAICIDDKIDGARILKFDDAPAMLTVYQKYCDNFYIKPLRTLQDMQNKLVENLNFGYAMGFFKNDELMAYSFEKTQGNGDEVCYVDKFYINTLGLATMRKSAITGHIDGLLRVINIEKFVNEIKFNNQFIIDWKIKFTDDIVEQNNITLRLKIESGKSTVQTLERDEFDIEYSVSDFVNTVVHASENVIF